ncbi:MAG TPA: heme exporter protein CcmB [Myxococcales bacterium]|jgi:heme exporter protein B
MQLWAVLQKDLVLSWRTRGQAAAVFAFGATAMLLLGFAAGPDSRALRHGAAGFLWVSLVFGSVLALSESFRHEHARGALEALALLPARPSSIFLSKALANAAQLFVLGLALVPVMALFCDATPTRLLELAAVVALGAAGLAAPGTFYAAMTSQTRGAQVLLPLLLLPLVAPVLLAATRATSLLLSGDPMEQLGSWMGLLLAFDLVFWPLGAVLFGAVLEE